MRQTQPLVYRQSHLSRYGYIQFVSEALDVIRALLRECDRFWRNSVTLCMTLVIV